MIEFTEKDISIFLLSIFTSIFISIFVVDEIKMTVRNNYSEIAHHVIYRLGLPNSVKPFQLLRSLYLLAIVFSFSAYKLFAQKPISLVEIITLGIAIATFIPILFTLVLFLILLILNILGAIKDLIMYAVYVPLKIKNTELRIKKCRILLNYLFVMSVICSIFYFFANTFR